MLPVPQVVAKHEEGQAQTEDKIPEPHVEKQVGYEYPGECGQVIRVGSYGTNKVVKGRKEQGHVAS
jgi:hypothetical protein